MTDHPTNSSPTSSDSSSTTPTNTPHPVKVKEERPLFLAIESRIKGMRAVVLDEGLEVVRIEEVRFEGQLAEEFRTYGQEVTAPSAMRIKGLDLLLEKLAQNSSSDASLIGRIRAISGCGQQHAAYYLSHAFPSLLAATSTNPSSRLSSLLLSHLSFSLESPAISIDSSTANQCAELEAILEQRLPVSSCQGAGPRSRNRGAIEMARRTGSRACKEFTAAQVMKVRQVYGGRDGRMRVLDGTGRICLESNFLASLFLGRIAPIDSADACGTNLYNVLQGDWDDEILGIVMGDHERRRTGSSREEPGASRLRSMLGTVEKDGGRELGKISEYFVRRFGFSNECIVIPFTGDVPAAFLSHNLGPRDVMLSLGDSDHMMVPSPQYIPDPAHHMMPHPALSPGPPPPYIAVISNKGAGDGRGLARDCYSNGSWPVFSRLVDIVEPGGSIGYVLKANPLQIRFKSDPLQPGRLDNKSFTFFLPDRGVLLRTISGVPVPDFADRKIHPRLILESQFLSLRLRLSRIYTTLTDLSTSSTTTRIEPKAYNSPIGFKSTSLQTLPSRIILGGAAADNSSITSLLSTILGAPAVISDTGRTLRLRGMDGMEASRSALGVGYKAAWAFARASGNSRSFADFARKAEESPRSSPAPQPKAELRTEPLTPTNVTGSGQNSEGEAGPVVEVGDPRGARKKIVGQPDFENFRYYCSSKQHTREKLGNPC
ncbi:hypothetical protein P7C70_g4177, partial [Phenoliferia sp. Uapishka_3]